MSEELEKCNHCWHDAGIIITAMSAQSQQYCCYCGKYRLKVTQNSNVSQHGPYYHNILGCN